MATQTLLFLTISVRRQMFYYAHVALYPPSRSDKRFFIPSIQIYAPLGDHCTRYFEWTEQCTLENETLGLL